MLGVQLRCSDVRLGTARLRRARRAARAAPRAADIGGDYGEADTSYADVDTIMLNYFTYKAREAVAVIPVPPQLWPFAVSAMRGTASLTLRWQALRMTLQQLQETDTSPGKGEYSALPCRFEELSPLAGSLTRASSLALPVRSG